MKEFIEKITNKEASIFIIGMGYVGLPLALACVKKGFFVHGFDLNEVKVNILSSGKSDISTICDQDVALAIESEHFTVSSDGLSGDGLTDDLVNSDIVIICVPTPLTVTRDPDLTYITSATQTVINSGIINKKLIILESTTYPKTTSVVLRNMIENQTSMVLGTDYFLAFSPEREDPGNKNFTTTTMPKVVGGVDKSSSELVTLFYKQIIDKVVPVSSSDVAEAVKLTENIFRSVNIALVNELKMVYDAMGIDVWEVLDAAETKPFGFMRFNPGPGLGGHCIPLDPFYLSWKAKEFKVDTKFIELAGEINRSMPKYVVQKIIKALNKNKCSVNDSNILIVGIAYKKDIEDTRETPALPIMLELKELGATVQWYDPLVIKNINIFHGFYGYGYEKEITEKDFRKFDCVVIVTDHSCIDYDMIGDSCNVVVDTRNVCRKGYNVTKA